MNTVLIVGLGKIGKFKAQVYRELGYEVSVVDPAIDLTKPDSLTHGYNCYNAIADIELNRYNVVDICTPTVQHITVFEKLLQYFPRSLFVIEKPLCSTKKALKRFEFLIKNYPETIVIYSENYIFSVAINEISRLIVENDLDIKKIEMEFSKNRKTDIKNGRFVDTELEGFGIEVPHMLMIANRLGHRISSIEQVVTKDMKISSKILLERQGEIKVCATLDKTIPFVFYQSMIGKTLLKSKYFRVPNAEKNRSNRYRVLRLKCNHKSDIYVQFEPIEGKDRFISKITLVVNGVTVEEFEVEDNTLRYLLKHVDDVAQKRVTRNKYLSPQYAAQVTKNLITLKELSISNKLPFDCAR